MTLVFALAVGVLFGTGAYLLLSRDLVRVVLGVVLISHAVGADADRVRASRAATRRSTRSRRGR